MDPISQGAVGAGFAQHIASRKTLRAAAIVGTVAGIAPDLDVLIRSSTDPLLFLEYHRHFTHSLAFIPLGALLCAGICYRFVSSTLTFNRTYLVALIAYATHGILDACTTFGTQLLWPFSDARIAWHIVAAIDPFFTVPVMALLIIAFGTRRKSWATGAMAWAAAYLAFGAWQHERAVDAVTSLAVSRGHSPIRVAAFPFAGSLFLWRGVYATETVFHLAAVRAAGGITVFDGGTVPALNLNADLPWLIPGSQQATDLARFIHISDGFVGFDASSSIRIIDLRFSAIPNDADGLWWIELDPTAGDSQHVRFRATTNIDVRRGLELFRMLLGRPGDE